MNRLWMGLIAVVAVLAAFATFEWRKSSERESNARTELLRVTSAGLLQPASERLKANAALVRKLESPEFSEPGADILQSYLKRIRRDGVPKTAAMRQRIDELVNGNTEVLTLVSVYIPRATTAEFAAAVEHFREYSLTFRDRWQSLPEVFMAGGEIAASLPDRTEELSRAVGAEIRASGPPASGS